MFDALRWTYTQTKEASVTASLINPQPGEPNSIEASDLLLRQQTQSKIREAIIDGRFSAGQKLTERSLREFAGASRSSLREALSHLEAKGLLVREPHRGFAVAKVELRSVYEIFELRMSVETLAAELFAERAGEREIEEIKTSIVQLKRGVRENDMLVIRGAKDRFYNSLFAGCRNREIRGALENVIDRIYYLRSRLMSDPERAQASVREMERLAQALVNRDRDGARNASIAHLESARQALVKQVSGSD